VEKSPREFHVRSHKGPNSSAKMNAVNSWIVSSTSANSNAMKDLANLVLYKLNSHASVERKCTL
jgi:hypothetical protein